MDTVYSKELDKFLTSRNIPVVVHRYFKNYKDQLKAAYKKESSMLRFFAVGSMKNKEWIDGLIKKGIKHFCVDMAHGHTDICYQTVKYIKKECPESIIMAGNVATKSGFRKLESAGAWAVRVGVGSGSICSTRLNTGFGVPLLTSIADCATIKDKALIIADGGMKHPGDMAKAIAFGADLCMTGRMFAATDLAPGDCYDVNKDHLCCYNEMDQLNCYPSYKRYRGMASAEARKGVLKKASVEGVSGLIPYEGSTEDFVDGLTANLKASLSYGGSRNWHQFKRNVKKIKITSASWNESQTHVEA
jgi:IMP dehydrogenase